MTGALRQLSAQSLRALAASCRQGALQHGFGRHAVSQIVGSRCEAVVTCLEGLARDGMAPGGVAVLLEVLAGAREREADLLGRFDLVLSGPDAPGLPTRDTAAVVYTLIEGAKTEVLMVGYAVHDGRRLFERLAARMAENPALRVVFCLDIQRPYGDTSLASEIVRRFALDFRARHWPWPVMPELWYDPRSLTEGAAARSCLHAKCVVVDRREALVTSANFTEAAQQRNIEAGVLIRHEAMAARIADHFLALRTSGMLVRCALE